MERRLDREGVREEGRVVGPDGPEGYVPEVQKPGEADDHVEAHSEKDIDRHLGGEDRLDTSVEVQRPLDRHQEGGDRERGLAIREPGLFRDPGELVLAMLGT